MKRQIAFLVSAMMTVNLFTAVPAFATDDFSDAEVVVEEDSNEDAEEMEIQDSTEEDFEDEGAVTEDSAASESEVDSVTDVDLFSDADSEDAVAESKQLKMHRLQKQNWSQALGAIIRNFFFLTVHMQEESARSL